MNPFRLEIPIIGILKNTEARKEEESYACNDQTFGKFHVSLLPDRILSWVEIKFISKGPVRFPASFIVFVALSASASPFYCEWQ